MKVLFVCLGNICRSPLAEAMFRQMVAEQGLSDHITIDSAGTSSEEEGNHPYPGIQRIMTKYHLAGHDLVSRPITMADFDNFDLIIGMDDMNIRHLKSIAPAADLHKIHGINDLVPGKAGEPLPDPWYTHEFQKTYDALHLALPYWLDYVQAQQ
ncbi:low molecular weight protein-tyrosine-phosphatase [Limosilactobacillus caecicola]|uniref:low molecular weight protein-tyrosine-phosphatase n=1 Tax=Limosilactobacillus caecicola TaxID=2941332 RepID=UPI0020418BF0|nr:low molecular weight protein-tyrosine-phosphatase [Limosilactobacillus caecicola]